jgi:hypothetical protein
MIIFWSILVGAAMLDALCNLWAVNLMGIFIAFVCYAFVGKSVPYYLALADDQYWHMEDTLLCIAFGCFAGPIYLFAQAYVLPLTA